MQRAIPERLIVPPKRKLCTSCGRTYVSNKCLDCQPLVFIFPLCANDCGRYAEPHSVVCSICGEG